MVVKMLDELKIVIARDEERVCEVLQMMRCQPGWYVLERCCLLHRLGTRCGLQLHCDHDKHLRSVDGPAWWPMQKQALASPRFL